MRARPRAWRRRGAPAPARRAAPARPAPSRAAAVPARWPPRSVTGRSRSVDAVHPPRPACLLGVGLLARELLLRGGEPPEQGVVLGSTAPRRTCCACEQLLRVQHVEGAERSAGRRAPVDGRGPFTDEVAHAAYLGARRADARPGVGDGGLRLLQREDGAVVPFAERLDLMAVRLDLGLDGRGRPSSSSIGVCAGAGHPAQEEAGGEREHAGGGTAAPTSVGRGRGGAPVVRVARGIRVALVADQGR